MGNRLPTRFEQIESAFAHSRNELQLQAVKDGFGPEELLAYERQLRCWFHGFARRPGNDHRPAEALRGELLSAAHEYSSEYKKFCRQLKALQTETPFPPATITERPASRKNLENPYQLPKGQA